MGGRYIGEGESVLHPGTDWRGWDTQNTSKGGPSIRGKEEDTKLEKKVVPGVLAGDRDDGRGERQERGRNEERNKGGEVEKRGVWGKGGQRGKGGRKGKELGGKRGWRGDEEKKWKGTRKKGGKD